MGVVAAFVAFAALLGLAEGVPREFQEEASRVSQEWGLRSTPFRMQGDGAPTRYLIDGFNVLNVAVLRGDERRSFWGPDARERLLELVARRGDANAIVVVFDGPRPLESTRDDTGAQVVFAEDADAWMLRALRERPNAEGLAVVTADRRLAARARHRGAVVVDPRRFVAQCEGHPGTDDASASSVGLSAGSDRAERSRATEQRQSAATASGEDSLS